MVNQSSSAYTLPSQLDTNDDDDFYKFKCLSLNDVPTNNNSSAYNIVFEFPPNKHLQICSSSFAWSGSTTSLRRPSSLSAVSLPCNLMESYTVVILGELSVGKSALCQNFFRTGIKKQLENVKQNKIYADQSVVADDTLDAAVEETVNAHCVYERPVKVNGQNSKISILDVNTEKQITESLDADGFDNLDPLLESGDGYIVAYAITDKGTFQTAQDILNKITQSHSEDQCARSPIILVGNKCDLVRRRQVSTNHGIKMAEKYGAKFLETSASLNQNVDKLFEGIINQIRLKKEQNLKRTSLFNMKKYEPKNRLQTAIRKSFHSIRSNRDESTLCHENIGGKTEIESSSKSICANQSLVVEAEIKSKKRSFIGRCKYGFMRRKTTGCVNNCQDMSIL